MLLETKVKGNNLNHETDNSRELTMHNKEHLVQDLEGQTPVVEWEMLWCAAQIPLQGWHTLLSGVALSWCALAGSLSGDFPQQKVAILPKVMPLPGAAPIQ